MTGLQVLRRLKARIGVSLPAVALFEAPTVAALAADIAAGRAEARVPALVGDTERTASC